MPIDYEKLMALEFPDREFSYDERDTQLYALAVGMGRNLPAELSFIHEQGLQALPTQAVVVAWDDHWQERTGMDISRIVHGEQSVTMHRALAPAGRVRSRVRIMQAFDKGPGRGAVLLVQTKLHDVLSNGHIATLLSTVFARGDGGFGGPGGRGPEPHPMPTRTPDRSVQVQIRPEQAALYRLCGDRNPLHVDVAFARAVGYERPILHGLCSWGMAAAVVVREACRYEAARLRHFEARFTAPVEPGQTLSVDLWLDGEEVSLRAHVDGTVVLNHGLARIEPT